MEGPEHLQRPSLKLDDLAQHSAAASGPATAATGREGPLQHHLSQQQQQDSDGGGIGRHGMAAGTGTGNAAGTGPAPQDGGPPGWDCNASSSSHHTASSASRAKPQALYLLNTEANSLNLLYSAWVSRIRQYYGQFVDIVQLSLCQQIVQMDKSAKIWGACCKKMGETSYFTL